MRSHRACVWVAAERAGRSDRCERLASCGRALRLAEAGLQRSPPGDAGTARRGMKVWGIVGLQFQPKQWAKKGAVKTANQIESRTQPELVPNQAPIVRGAL